MRALRSDWLRRRRRLHAAYMQRCRPVDASQLTFEGLGRGWMTQDDVRDLWSRAPGRRTVNHVYVHVPFCKSICSFCNYERLRPSDPAVLRTWLDRVKGSLAVLGPATRHLRFHSLYFGGGTPSVLPAAMIREVVQAIHSSLRFHTRVRRSFELDPAVMNRSKLNTLMELGFRHFSFGVQTLDAGVNDAHNRGRQGRELVARRFEEFADAGAQHVSCDFILGLAGTSPGQLFSEIDETLRRWRPRWIDVYQLTPTEDYLASHFGGQADAFWAHLRPFQEQVHDALQAMANAHGYRLQRGGGHRYALTRRFSLRGLAEVKPMRLLTEGRQAYTQNISDQGRALNLLGLGPSARSRIFGVAQFEARDPADDPSLPGPARYHGRSVELSRESLSYLVFALRDRDVVDRRQFRSIFGEDILALHGEAVAAWTQERILQSMTRRTLTLHRQSRQERLRSLLWLVPDADLELEIAQHSGLDLTESGLTRRLYPLAEGVSIGGFQLTNIAAARLELSSDSARVQLRVTPPLQDDAGLGLVVESGLPTDEGEQRALRQAVGVIRRAIS